MASIFEPMFPTYIASEYITSSDDHKINTGVVATQNTKIECWFEVNEVKVNGLLFGCREGWQMTNSLIYMPSYTDEKDLIQIGDISERVPGVPRNRRCKVEVNNKQISTFYVNDDGLETVVMRRRTEADFITPGPIYILGGDSGDRPFVAPVCKVFSFKIWDNGTLVRDFVPISDPSDDRSALYDSVSGEIFFPETGSPFGHGPAGYEAEIEYVMTSEGGGYDLPIYPLVENRIALETWIEFISGNTDLGVAVGDDGNGTGQFRIMYGGENFVTAIHGWNAIQAPRTGQKDMVVIRVNPSSNSYYWQVNWDKSGTCSNCTFEDGAGRMTIGHPATTSPTQKVYGFKWYEQEWNLLHDYQPVLAQGVPCLYDKVTGELIRPRGGLGSVSAGPITYMKLPPFDSIAQVFINGIEQSSISDVDGNAIWPRNSY